MLSYPVSDKAWLRLYRNSDMNSSTAAFEHKPFEILNRHLSAVMGELNWVRLQYSP